MRIVWAYNTDLSKVGKTEDVPPEEAARWIREGRARLATAKKQAAKRTPRKRAEKAPAKKTAEPKPAEPTDATS